MRACLLLCAALALAPSRPRAAASHIQPQQQQQQQPAHQRRHQPEPRLEHIKTQILAKLGLSSRPTPLGAPPRDVVRQILARAADPQPEHLPEPEHSMREIIAIAHRVFRYSYLYSLWMLNILDAMIYVVLGLDIQFGELKARFYIRKADISHIVFEDLKRSSSIIKRYVM